MSFLKKSEIKKLGQQIRATKEITCEAYDPQDHFDVFLSHSSLDKFSILGLQKKLSQHGLTVYIDWAIDPELDRSQVTQKTAHQLRLRMKQCSCLLFATSDNSSNSKWMPWECGYFDALKGKVAIVPLLEDEENSFKGQEYLGLYPYVDEVCDSLWINTNQGGSEELIKWK